ncbi:MAG: Asd/ArgC dimerization domain-containing protein [Gammaproteobacteria bacterium]|nr:Asd/ArgC dimerization domain-containing protein [Gammaproteobacteria bacterium]
MEARIALAPAAGLAAEAILERLDESGLPPDSLVLLDVATHAGERLAYGGTHLRIEDQAEYDFGDCALLLLPQQDPALVERAAAAGCIVLSHELPRSLPLLFTAPGQQEPVLDYTADRFRVAGPELACILPSLVLLERNFGLEAVNLVTLRSAEFHGRAGVEELAAQTISLLNAREAAHAIFPAQLAFNLLPERGDPGLLADLRGILVNSSYTAMQQSVNVPLFHGFVAALQLRLATRFDLAEVEGCLAGGDRLLVRHEQTSPISDCNQSFSGIISQLETNPDQPPDLQFWIVADPLRYGLANNYVNVTEFLLKSYL